MAKRNYGKLLLDPRWQAVRIEVLLRDNKTCRLCGDTRTTLHVHHEKYQGAPWDIPMEFLKTLCAHCHSIIHAIPQYEVVGIHKQISLSAKCWEVVAFTTTHIVFLYLFFETGDENLTPAEIVTVLPNPIKKAA